MTLGLPITVASIDILTAANETLLCFLTRGLPGLTSEDFRGLSRLSTTTSTLGFSSSELDELDELDDLDDEEDDEKSDGRRKMVLS